MRQTWDHYFMDNAFMVAKRGTCDRRRVGAILVKDKRIKSTGYNGSPAGLEHCDDVGHLMINGHCVRTSHAEENCLNNADVEAKRGATIYVTDEPCINCQKLIISAGIKRVVYARDYKPEVNFFEGLDIEVIHLSDYVIKDFTDLKKKAIFKLVNEEIFKERNIDGISEDVLNSIIEKTKL